MIGKDWHILKQYHLKRLQGSTFILTVRKVELRVIRQTETPTVSVEDSQQAWCFLANIRSTYGAAIVHSVLHD